MIINKSFNILNNINIGFKHNKKNIKINNKNNKIIINLLLKINYITNIEKNTIKLLYTKNQPCIPLIIKNLDKFR